MQSFFKGRWVRLAVFAATLSMVFAAGFLAKFALDSKERIMSRFLYKEVSKLANIEVANWRRIETGLVSTERADIKLGDTVNSTSGGAISSIGNTILYVSASGYIGTVGLHEAKIEYSHVRVPMDYDRLQSEVFAQHSLFNNEWFRVQDILIKPEAAPGQATLYVSHHVFVPESTEICSVSSHTRLNSNGSSIEFVDGIWQELYRMNECVSMEEFDWEYYGLESGGRMMLLDDDHILMGVGDYGIAWDLFTHDRVGLHYDNHFAKILAIDIRTGKAEIYANGVRNPQGLVRDSDGNIWGSEHGPHGGDEVNLVVPGADFGWPKVSLGMNYGSPREPISTNPVQGRHDGFDRPVMAFMPSIGISGLAAMPEDPAMFKLWKGDLLAPALRDQSLYRLLRHGKKILYTDKIPLESPVRDIELLDNGWIAILEFDDKGLILLKEIRDDQAEVSEPIRISGYAPVNELQAAVRLNLGDTNYGRSIFRDPAHAVTV